jgi:DNA polymerase III subunit epsilon
MRIFNWLIKNFFRRTTHAANNGKTVERWVVVDVETSGLDLNEAQLLAIAGIAIEINWSTGKLTIIPGDSFEVDIRPVDVVKDKENILIHGIGQQRQLQGMALEEALSGFLAFIGQTQLFAFHAWFDKALINRHIKMINLTKHNHGLTNSWIDIEKLCQIAHPDKQAHSLDEWMQEFGISCPARHEAAADTFAESEILQRIWPDISRQVDSWQDLVRLEKQSHWLVTNNRKRA